MRVAKFVALSEANAPGPHSVLWAQGCLRDCPGCCNQDFRPVDTGEFWGVEKILEEISPQARGIVFTGGEPLLSKHRPDVFRVAQTVKSFTRRPFGVVIYTGNTREDLAAICPSVFALADIIIAGPYREDLVLGQGMRASSNQEVILLSNFYSWQEVAAVPPSETTFNLDTGRFQVTGVRP